MGVIPDEPPPLAAAMDGDDFEALVGMHVTAWRLRQRVADFLQAPGNRALVARRREASQESVLAAIATDRKFHEDALAALDWEGRYFEDWETLRRVNADLRALLDRIAGIPAQPDAEEAP